MRKARVHHLDRHADCIKATRDRRLAGIRREQLLEVAGKPERQFCLEKQDDNLIKEHGEVWGEILASTLKHSQFDIFEYKKRLTTLNKLVEYPDGRGWVQDVNPDGSLSVKTVDNEIINLVSPLISELN